jgi:excisionase family DNA binding protein
MEGTERPLRTRQEALEWLRISSTTLWELTASGELPAVRLGRAVRYRVEDIERFIERHLDGRGQKG